MELIPETSIYGKYYSNLLEQVEWMKPDCEKILQKLSAEERATLTEFYRLRCKLYEVRAKFSYALGYSEGKALQQK